MIARYEYRPQSLASALSAFTSGSIIYFDGTTLAEDNANLFYDSTAKAVGIGSNAFPLSEKLSVWPNSDVTIVLGQIVLQGFAGFALISQYNNSGFTSVGFAQGPAGDSFFNAPIGTSLNFSIALNAVIVVTAGFMTTAPGVVMKFSGATSGFTGLQSKAAASSLTYTLWDADVANGVITSNGSQVLSLALITNSNIAAGAAIAVSKLAALTASRIVVSDGSGFLSVNAALTANKVAYATASGAIASNNLFHIDVSIMALGVGTSTPKGTLHATNSRDQPGLQITANAAQTTDLIVIESSGGTKSAGVDSVGRFQCPAASTSTVSLPGFSIENDTGTGNYTAGLNQWGVSCGGAAIQTWEGTKTNAKKNAVYEQGIYLERKTATNVNYNVVADDTIVACSTTTSVINVNLIAASSFIQDGSPGILIIKDEGGNAGTNNITVVPNGTDKIDGVNASFTINTNYGVTRLYAISGNWFKI